MTSRGASTPPASPGRELWIAAAAVGPVSGLVEGGIHLGLQHVGVLDNSWYPIVWIAALFNTGILLLVALLLTPVVAAFPGRSIVRTVAVFTMAAAAILPCVALLLREWIEPYAIGILTIGAATALTRAYLGRSASALRAFRRMHWPAAAAVLLAIVAIEGGQRVVERVRTSQLPPAPESAPNVLLIVVDALRADHLSTMHYGRPTSPAIDRLAADGVVFEHAFATSSYTLPSHVSMLTGLSARDHAVDWNTSHAFRSSAVPVLSEVLLANGYRTAAFSGNTFYFSREHGFGRGFLHFEDFFHSWADRWWRTAYGGVATRLVRPRLGFEDLPGRKLATETNSAVLDWVGRGPDRPFFVMINYMDVHDPYLPPQPFRGRFSTQPNPGGALNFKLHIPDHLTAEALQGEIDAYDGAIAYVDDAIRQLLDQLRPLSERELVVMLTSDHGEEFAEHGGYLHARHLYTEAIQVPLIVSSPGRVPGGRRVRQPVTNAAIPATIVDLLGLSGSSFPGPSLKRLWTEPAASAEEWPNPVSDLNHRPWADPKDPVQSGSIRSMVTPSWHYVEHDKTGPELYERPADAADRHNVVGRPEFAEPARALARQLAAGGTPDPRSSVPR